MTGMSDPRVVLFMILKLATTALVAQEEWSMTFPSSGHNRWISDAVVLGDGYVAISTGFGGILNGQTQAHLIKLDHNGLPVVELPFHPGAFWTLPSVLIPGPEGERLHVLGTRTLDGVAYQLFHHILTNDLQPIDSLATNHPEMTRLVLDNALLTSDGTITAAVFGRTANAWLYDRTIVIKLDLSGDSLTSAMFQVPIFFNARDVVELNSDTLLFVGRGAHNWPDDAATYYLLRKDDLSVIDEFTANAYDGSGEPVYDEEIVLDQIHLIPLESGNILSAGITGRPIRAVIHKLSLDGSVLGHFAPPSNYRHDFSGYLRNTIRTPDGHVLFLRSTNFFPGPPSPWLPTEPNEVIIYKLDTALNLLCADTITGWNSDHNYFINRIKATPDGGYLLMGMRADVSQQPVYFEGWMGKYPAMDCTTGIASTGDARQVTLFPNPGSTELHLSVNGSTFHQGSIRLHDGRGAAVLEQTIRSNFHRLDVSSLASGLYFYQVLDDRHNVVARGKWVKH
jgi:hypothetical protein